MTSGPALTGTRILVTAQRRAGDLALALGRRGAEVDVASALGVESQLDEDALVAATLDLVDTPPDIVVITTGIGFRGWWEAAEAAGTGEALWALLDRTRLIARGPKARGALQAVGLRPDWVAESETSHEIGELLTTEGVQGARIAVQHHGSGDDGLAATLRAAGAAEVTPLVVYRWGPPPDEDAVRRSIREVAAGRYDAVLFTSAPAAAAWIGFAEAERVLDRIGLLAGTGRLALAAVGPVTAEPLRHRGLEVLVPERGRLGALVRHVVVHLGAEDGGVLTTAGRLRLHATAATVDHRPLPVSPSGLVLLRRLAEEPGAIVSRDEVLDVLPGDSRDPHAAEVAVARLREAWGPDHPVQTVVKRGYRLSLPDAP